MTNSTTIKPVELAQTLRLHRETIMRHIRKGNIHAIQTPGGWRIPNEEASRILRHGLLPQRSEPVPITTLNYHRLPNGQWESTLQVPDITAQDIEAIIGPPPTACSFCLEPRPPNELQPEEGGHWACTTCLQRWQAQDHARAAQNRQAPSPHVAQRPPPNQPNPPPLSHPLAHE